MSVHEKCQGSVTLSCYTPTLAHHSDNQILYHHNWLQGNVPKQPCIVCLKKVSTSNGGFQASQCTACQKVIHNNCIQKHQHNGQGGFCSPQFGDMFFCQELIDMANPPSIYKPLLVFVNGKSGGQQGLVVLRKMLGLLTQQQVVSLLDEKPVGPGRALDAYCNVSNLRILVCGGDGTAAWVMAEMFDKRTSIAQQAWIPPIAVLPLGTGNDLARVLDWGGG
jgi:diacylglycerol kinase (ATP)